MARLQIRVVCVILLISRVTCAEFCEEDGEIRLTNSTSPLEGRVEWCRDGQWGTICDPFRAENGSWDNLNARVVCRQVGRQLGVQIFTGIARGTLFVNTPQNLPIHQQTGISCTGNENSLVDCPVETPRFSCGHYSDVGVTCIPTDSPLLPTCSDELLNYNGRSIPFACHEQSSENSTCLVDKNLRSTTNDLLCNGRSECGDCSDECHCMGYERSVVNQCGNSGSHCTSLSISNQCRNSRRTVTTCNCTEDEFQCDNGFCVPTDWMCTGVDGCGDYSDETNDYCRELIRKHRQEFDDEEAVFLGLSLGLAIGLAAIIFLLIAMVLVPCLLVPRCPLRKLYSATPPMVRAAAAAGVGTGEHREGSSELTENPVERSNAPLVTGQSQP